VPSRWRAASRFAFRVYTDAMLAHMDARDRERYIDDATDRFGRALARVFDLEADKAAESAREHLAEILPDRGGTTLHHFRHILSEGSVVGEIWFAERPVDDPPQLYLYEIHVREDARGSGHGRAALTELEEIAREAGLTRILLSVFAYNEGAIRLYERLGYTTEEMGTRGRRMSKVV
jgi:ribosomal protein S18 acetylase RimI-like enzyme